MVCGGAFTNCDSGNDDKALLMKWKVNHGDCLEIMRKMKSDSVDSIVTDPPYGWNFMGKKWDADLPLQDIWEECLRVAKPGAHLLAFGGTRTFHRLACAIEDAGWEMRDMLMWIHGQGFPKNHDVSKKLDKMAGVEREVVGEYSWPDGLKRDTRTHTTKRKGIYQDIKTDDSLNDRSITAPATDAAKKWEGWGTALKPAFEPICLARKPFPLTVAAQVLATGTGAINVDGCRIGKEKVTINTFDDGAKPFGDGAGHSYTSRKSQGRWPANLLFDEEAAAMLDEQSGELKSGDLTGQPRTENKIFNSAGSTLGTPRYYKGDSGGASRFFYCAKASTEERNAGLPHGIFNRHPTIKPLSLMRWLVHLVTPPRGLILDPFAGSGTTGIAATQENFDFMGIEQEKEDVEIAKMRIAYSLGLFNINCEKRADANSTRN